MSYGANENIDHIVLRKLSKNSFKFGIDTDATTSDTRSNNIDDHLMERKKLEHQHALLRNKLHGAQAFIRGAQKKIAENYELRNVTGNNSENHESYILKLLSENSLLSERVNFLEAEKKELQVELVNEVKKSTELERHATLLKVALDDANNRINVLNQSSASYVIPQPNQSDDNRFEIKIVDLENSLRTANEKILLSEQRLKDVLELAEERKDRLKAANQQIEQLNSQLSRTDDNLASALSRLNELQRDFTKVSDELLQSRQQQGPPPHPITGTGTPGRRKSGNFSQGNVTTPQATTTTNMVTGTSPTNKSPNRRRRINYDDEETKIEVQANPNQLSIPDSGGYYTSQENNLNNRDGDDGQHLRNEMDDDNNDNNQADIGSIYDSKDQEVNQTFLYAYRLEISAYQELVKLQTKLLDDLKSKKSDFQNMLIAWNKHFEIALEKDSKNPEISTADDTIRSSYFNYQMLQICVLKVQIFIRKLNRNIIKNEKEQSRRNSISLENVLDEQGGLVDYQEQDEENSPRE